MKSFSPHRHIGSFLMLLFLLGCGKEKEIAYEGFAKDLDSLREYFHIPGMAVIVAKGDRTVYESYLGFSDVEKKIAMSPQTEIPMASLTKMYSGILAMRLAAQGVFVKPINSYIDGSNVGDSVKVKHILSHTSQGKVGKHFYYSGRYGSLTKVIEKEYGASLDELVQTLICHPYDLQNTYLLSDTAKSVAGRENFAKPYVFEGETKPGFVDFGYSAASGITSTVRDMVKFGKLIDNSPVVDEILRRDSLPHSNDVQYGYGMFVQNIESHDVIWAYGQYDCYSSLFLKVPDQQLTFVIAANNNLMSDPARLIYGDVRSSLFALSFFRNFLNVSLPREQLRAQAVAESFLAMYDSNRANTSKLLLRKLFGQYPDHKEYSDLTLLHNLMFLKEIGRSDEFDTQIKEIGAKLLAEDVDNPYANYYLGNYYEKKGIADSATMYYRRIVAAKNFERHWYTREAENYLSGKP